MLDFDDIVVARASLKRHIWPYVLKSSLAGPKTACARFNSRYTGSLQALCTTYRQWKKHGDRTAARWAGSATLKKSVIFAPQGRFANRRGGEVVNKKSGELENNSDGFLRPTGHVNRVSAP